MLMPAYIYIVFMAYASISERSLLANVTIFIICYLIYATKYIV